MPEQPVSGSDGQTPELRKRLCEKYCKRQACAIQFCLAKHRFQQQRCDPVIDDFENCCDFVVARFLKAQNKQKQ